VRRVSLGLKKTHRAVSVFGAAALVSADLAFSVGAASADPAPPADLAASLVSDNGRTCRTSMIPGDLETGAPLTPGSGLGVPLARRSVSSRCSASCAFPELAAFRGSSRGGRRNADRIDLRRRCPPGHGRRCSGVRPLRPSRVGCADRPEPGTSQPLGRKQAVCCGPCALKVARGPARTRDSSAGAGREWPIPVTRAMCKVVAGRVWHRQPRPLQSAAERRVGLVTYRRARANQHYAHRRRAAGAPENWSDITVVRR